MPTACELTLIYMHLGYKTKQILVYLFLLCFAFILNVSAQPSAIQSRIGVAKLYFDNGNFSKSIEVAQMAVEKANKVNDGLLISEGLQIKGDAQIFLQKYDEAENSLNDALRTISESNSNVIQRASIYLSYARLCRSQRKFGESLNYLKKAITLAPDNRQILAENNLNLGRILFTSGYDVSAIIWLEKAEQLLASEKTSSAKLDVYRFLALAWWAKLNYQTALKYTGKWEAEARNTRFKRQYRQALLDSATILSESGQQTAAFRTHEKGLKLALVDNNPYQAGIFLTSLLLNSLDNDEVVKASAYLEQLEKINENKSFSFEIILGKAIISAFTNESEKSNELFSQLDKMENSSDFILPGWRVKIAERNKNWKELIQFNHKLLDLTVENNFRDELPVIHLNFARAYFNLNQFQLSQHHLEKSLAYIEEIRQSEDNNLSLGLFETYHDAYRLLAQINIDKPRESFEQADLLKARLLNDKINNSSFNSVSVISGDVRLKLEELSLKYIENQSIAAEIGKIEKYVTAKVPELNLTKPDLSELDNISNLTDIAIISYFFTLDNGLLAYVWEKNKPIRTVYLPVSKDEAETIAITTQQKIKDLLFFKKDGKELYDKLVKPLNILAKHLVIVPDKSLWKIPFQALSLDGKKYLIEDQLVSYAPSVSILLQQLKNPKPNRQSLQAFANSTYENQFLRYVTAEATSVAAIYNAKPVLNATKEGFERVSDKSDVLHFSMHAQVSNEQPLDSFLAFKPGRGDDGRLSVEELLKVKLKKGSLVFLASCDTNNVLNGEGLVSIPWAMMGSGASTVISAQWEANDKSTEIFTKTFYKFYKGGDSAADALQKTSIEMIRNKTGNVHEPYYWADFSVNGDFR